MPLVVTDPCIGTRTSRATTSFTHEEEGLGVVKWGSVAYAHSEVWRGLHASAGELKVVEPRTQYAWMGLVEYWKNGGTAPVWFFANPDRTDLALKLSESCHGNAHLEMAVEDVVVDRWVVTTNSRKFLRFVDLPGGALTGPGNYATLSIRASAGVRDDPPVVFIRQFDIQSTSQLIYAFAEGWHSQELDPATGRLWRWTSERSVLRVKGSVQDLRLTLRGESPLRYFDSPPTVTLTVGDRFVAEVRPDDDFEWQIIIPGADVARSGGAIVIETDRVYLPAEAEGTADQRRLGLRILECRVEPVTADP